MAAATNRIIVVVVNYGGGSLQCHGNDVLPLPPAPLPLLLLPLALDELHARPGNLGRSEGALRIIKPSVTSHYIFEGGRQGGRGVDANNDDDGNHHDNRRGNDGGVGGLRL
jgi:hypothetical protein